MMMKSLLHRVQKYLTPVNMADFFFFQWNFPIITENNTGKIVFHPRHHASHCPYQYLSLRWGDMTDTHVLSIIFLPSMLMLIFT